MGAFASVTSFCGKTIVRTTYSICDNRHSKNVLYFSISVIKLRSELMNKHIKTTSTDERDNINVQL